MKNTLVSLFLIGGIASAYPSIDYQCRLGRYAKSGSTETEETLSMVWNGVRYQGGIQAKLLGNGSIFGLTMKRMIFVSELRKVTI